jgi:hypothetical protein
MPVITTTASLSNQGFFAPISLNLPSGGFISYAVGSFPDGSWTPASSGNSYVAIGSGLVKLNSSGNIVWQFNSAYPGNCVNIDSSENIYTGGQGITKYNSSGVFQWTKRLVPVIPGDAAQTFGIQFDSSDNPLVLYSNLSFYANPVGNTTALYVLAKYTTTGTLTNQRRVLLLSTSPAYLGNDVTNGSVIVSGKSYATPSNPGIYNCAYPWSNTTSPNTILTQTTTSGTYAPAEGNDNQFKQAWIVSDGSFYYQIAYRLQGGQPYYVYVKINRTTGAISYSNSITLSGDKLRLTGIAIDNSGGLYVLGEILDGTRPYCYIAKISTSTGNMVWEKTLSVSSGTATTKSLAWNNGFLYVRTILFGASTYTTLLKLSDTGSTPDGTYGTYFILTTVSSTQTAVNSSSTGTTNDSVSTTTFSEATPTGSTSSSSYTLTTVAL